MSEENRDVEVEKNSPEKSGKKSSFQFILSFFEGVAWLSDKAMSFLRLFAVTILFTIVVNLVYRAIKNADVVVVKPFSVPESISGTNHQAGRIIANFLKQDLKQKEQQFNASIKGRLRNSSSIAGEDELDTGANIKLPQTGISINDVVDFISTLFGKQSITGTVYEDKKALYLQLELQGRVLSFEHPLEEDKSKLKQLEEMLNKQSSKKILSVAFENYNLYYYCNGEVSAIEQHANKYKKWFGYCQDYRELKDEKGILTLKNKVGSSKNQKQAKQDSLIALMLTSIKHKIQEKENLLAQAKQKVTNQNTVNKGKQDKTAVLSPSVMGVVISPATERHQEKETGSQYVAKLLESGWEPVDQGESDRKMADATLLYKLGLYEDAIEKDKEAIVANTNNATAWANLGLLYTMAEDEKYQDYDKAQALLSKAISLKKKWGWLQHSLCITQVYSQNSLPKSVQGLEKLLLKNESCQRARSLEPSKSVLYDKLYYIAMADKLYEEKNYDQAFATYKKCLSIDQRADCHMYDVMDKLRQLDTEDKVKGAGEYACKVLQEKAYFIKKQPSECDADLRLWQEECGKK